MKKLINAPERYVDEMLEGLTLAHPELSLIGDQGRVVARSTIAQPGKVGIVSGGGSGHLPLFCGYVGHGLLDACAIGNVFEGPNMASCEDAIRRADSGAGVLCLYGNYGGDRMNFDMASELVEMDSIDVKTVLGTDDIASAEAEEAAKRRGVAGLVFAFKTSGARAAKMGTLEQVAQIAQDTVSRTRTIGMGLSPSFLPGSSVGSFEIEPHEVEMGTGIHGEKGIWRAPLQKADQLVDEMVERLLDEKPDNIGSDVAVLVNGMGATSLEELFILYRRVKQRLDGFGFSIRVPLVGSFVTSMEMAGASLSLCFLDKELETLLKAPASCPFWKVGDI